MYGAPCFANGLGQCFRVLVGDQLGGMPTGTATNEMENDVLMYEQQITLNLIIEFVRHLCTAHVGWARLGPFTAYLAS